MGNNKAGWVLGGFVFIVGISVEVAFEEAGGTPLPIQVAAWCRFDLCGLPDTKEGWLIFRII